MNKTKIICTEHNNTEIKYLGQNISLENRTSKEIERRTTIWWKKFWSLKHILKGPFTLENKIKVIKSGIILTITYGTQTWSMTNKDEKRILVTQNSMEKAICGVKIKNKISMKSIKKK